MSLPLRDSALHTYGEYTSWREDQRYELIDGSAYAMSPAPSRLHQRFVGELYRQIADALESGPCEVNLAPFDIRLPEDDEADEVIKTVVQPDISVVCDPVKLDDRGCRGAPDWIIEVLSPASAAHDQIKKRALYERHCVSEYWLVHPTDHIVTVYCYEGDEFGKPVLYELEGTLPVSVLPEVKLVPLLINSYTPQTVKGLPA